MEPPSQLFASILDSLITAILVSAAYAVFKWISTPPLSEDAAPEIVPCNEISGVTRRQAKTANDWLFSGHTARFVSSQVVPRIAESAIATNTIKKIKLILINPNNVELCKEYSNYRSKVRSSAYDRDFKTEIDVQNQVIATVINCSHLNRKHAYTEIQIAFKDHLSTLRYDLTESACLVTNEDPREDGVLFRKGSLFYKQWELDLKQEWDFCKETALDLSKLSGPQNYSAREVHETLQNLGFLTFSINQERLNKITSIAASDRNPYR